MSFSASLIVVPPKASAQTLLNLPVPGAMVNPTQGFIPLLIKGIKVDQDNPFHFNFIVDTGHSRLTGEDLKDQSTKLIRYFLASLTVPEDELWVNLSPYQKDKIIPQGLGETEMGRDLLAQDYLLKQLTASLIYPEEDLGSEFWGKVYKKAYEEYGQTEIPVNTFNKVWIVPESATVYANGNQAFIVKSRMRVMLEEDYLALKVNKDNKKLGTDYLQQNEVEKLSSVSSSVIKEVIIPEIEREVNEGKNFAQLRQIYHSLILALWYKKNLKQSILNQHYADQNKIDGVELEDKQIKEKIYDQYIAAFKKGVYNYIKEDYDVTTKEIIPRKYFSGGWELTKDFTMAETNVLPSSAASPVGEYDDVDVNLVRTNKNISASPIDEENAVNLEDYIIYRKIYRADQETNGDAARFITEPENFKRVVEESTADLDPAKIDFLITRQAPIQQSILELVSNASDAITGRTSPIGRFGVGAMQMLAFVLDEDNAVLERGTHIVVKTLNSVGNAKRITFFKGTDGKIKFLIEDSTKAKQGTTVEIKFPEGIDKDLKSMLENFLRSRLNLFTKMRVKLNGELLNPLDDHIFLNGDKVRYDHTDKSINVTISDNTIIVEDTGSGMADEVLLDKYLIPRLGENQDAQKPQTDEDITKEVHIFFKGPQSTEKETKTRIVFQVAGINIQAIEIDGFGLPKELIIQLPSSTKLTVSRDRIEIDESTHSAIRAMAQKIVDSNPIHQIDLINGYMQAVKLLDEHNTRVEALQPLVDTAKEVFIPFVMEQEGLILPNDKLFRQMDVPANTLFLDESITYKISPDQIPGSEEIEDSFEAGTLKRAYVVPFKEDSTVSFLEHGPYLLINKIIYDRYKNYPLLFNFRLNFYVGYGKRAPPKGRLLTLQEIEENKKEDIPILPILEKYPTLRSILTDRQITWLENYVRQEPEKNDQVGAVYVSGWQSTDALPIGGMVSRMGKADDIPRLTDAVKSVEERIQDLDALKMVQLIGRLSIIDKQLRADYMKRLTDDIESGLNYVKSHILELYSTLDVAESVFVSQLLDKIESESGKEDKLQFNIVVIEGLIEGLQLEDLQYLISQLAELSDQQKQELQNALVENVLNNEEQINAFVNLVGMYLKFNVLTESDFSRAADLAHLRKGLHSLSEKELVKLMQNIPLIDLKIIEDFIQHQDKNRIIGSLLIFFKEISVLNDELMAHVEEQITEVKKTRTPLTTELEDIINRFTREQLLYLTEILITKSEILALEDVEDITEVRKLVKNSEISPLGVRDEVIQLVHNLVRSMRVPKESMGFLVDISSKYKSDFEQMLEIVADLNSHQLNVLVDGLVDITPIHLKNVVADLESAMLISISIDLQEKKRIVIGYIRSLTSTKDISVSDVTFLLGQAAIDRLEDGDEDSDELIGFTRIFSPFELKQFTLRVVGQDKTVVNDLFEQFAGGQINKDELIAGLWHHFAEMLGTGKIKLDEFRDAIDDVFIQRTDQTRKDNDFQRELRRLRLARLKVIEFFWVLDVRHFQGEIIRNKLEKILQEFSPQKIADGLLDSTFSDKLNAEMYQNIALTLEQHKPAADWLMNTSYQFAFLINAGLIDLEYLKKLFNKLIENDIRNQKVELGKTLPPIEGDLIKKVEVSEESLANLFDQLNAFIETIPEQIREMVEWDKILPFKGESQAFEQLLRNIDQVLMPNALFLAVNSTYFLNQEHPERLERYLSNLLTSKRLTFIKDLNTLHQLISQMDVKGLQELDEEIIKVVAEIFKNKNLEDFEDAFEAINRALPHVQGDGIKRVILRWLRIYDNDPRAAKMFSESLSREYEREGAIVDIESDEQEYDIPTEPKMDFHFRDQPVYNLQYLGITDDTGREILTVSLKDDKGATTQFLSYDIKTGDWRSMGHLSGPLLEGMNFVYTGKSERGHTEKKVKVAGFNKKIESNTIKASLIFNSEENSTFKSVLQHITKIKKIFSQDTTEIENDWGFSLHDLQDTGLKDESGNRIFLLEARNYDREKVTPETYFSLVIFEGGEGFSSLKKLVDLTDVLGVKNFARSVKILNRGTKSYVVINENFGQKQNYRVVELSSDISGYVENVMSTKLMSLAQRFDTTSKGEESNYYMDRMANPQMLDVDEDGNLVMVSVQGDFDPPHGAEGFLSLFKFNRETQEIENISVKVDGIDFVKGDYVTDITVIEDGEKSIVAAIVGKNPPPGAEYLKRKVLILEVNTKTYEMRTLATYDQENHFGKHMMPAEIVYDKASKAFGIVAQSARIIPSEEGPTGREFSKLVTSLDSDPKGNTIYFFDYSDIKKKEKSTISIKEEERSFKPFEDHSALSISLETQEFKPFTYFRQSASHKAKIDLAVSTGGKYKGSELFIIPKRRERTILGDMVRRVNPELDPSSNWPIYKNLEFIFFNPEKNKYEILHGKGDVNFDEEITDITVLDSQDERGRILLAIVLANQDIYFSYLDSETLTVETYIDGSGLIRKAGALNADQDDKLMNDDISINYVGVIDGMKTYEAYGMYGHEKVWFSIDEENRQWKLINRFSDTDAPYRRLEDASFNGKLLYYLIDRFGVHLFTTPQLGAIPESGFFGMSHAQSYSGFLPEPDVVLNKIISLKVKDKSGRMAYFISYNHEERTDDKFILFNPIDSDDEYLPMTYLSLADFKGLEDFRMPRNDKHVVTGLYTQDGRPLIIVENKDDFAVAALDFEKLEAEIIVMMFGKSDMKSELAKATAIPDSVDFTNEIFRDVTLSYNHVLKAFLFEVQIPSNFIGGGNESITAAFFVDNLLTKQKILEKSDQKPIKPDVSRKRSKIQWEDIPDLPFSSANDYKQFKLEFTGQYDDEGNPLLLGVNALGEAVLYSINKEGETVITEVIGAYIGVNRFIFKEQQMFKTEVLNENGHPLFVEINKEGIVSLRSLYNKDEQANTKLQYLTPSAGNVINLGYDSLSNAQVYFTGQYDDSGWPIFAATFFSELGKVFANHEGDWHDGQSVTVYFKLDLESKEGEIIGERAIDLKGIPAHWKIQGLVSKPIDNKGTVISAYTVDELSDGEEYTLVYYRTSMKGKAFVIEKPKTFSQHDGPAPDDVQVIVLDDGRPAIIESWEYIKDTADPYMKISILNAESLEVEDSKLINHFGVFKGEMGVRDEEGRMVYMAADSSGDGQKLHFFTFRMEFDDIKLHVHYFGENDSLMQLPVSAELIQFIPELKLLITGYPSHLEEDKKSGHRKEKRPYFIDFWDFGEVIMDQELKDEVVSNVRTGFEALRESDDLSGLPSLTRTIVRFLKEEDISLIQEEQIDGRNEDWVLESALDQPISLALLNYLYEKMSKQINDNEDMTFEEFLELIATVRGKDLKDYRNIIRSAIEGQDKTQRAWVREIAVQNARDATRRAREDDELALDQGDVSIRNFTNGDEWVFSVRDQGTGMSLWHLIRYFFPLDQSSKDYLTDTGNLGQGNYTLFADFDTVFMRTSTGNGTIHELVIMQNEEQGPVIVKWDVLKGDFKGTEIRRVKNQDHSDPQLESLFIQEALERFAGAIPSPETRQERKEEANIRDVRITYNGDTFVDETGFADESDMGDGWGVVTLSRAKKKYQKRVVQDGIFIKDPDEKELKFVPKWLKIAFERFGGIHIHLPRNIQLNIPRTGYSQEHKYIHRLQMAVFHNILKAMARDYVERGVKIPGMPPDYFDNQYVIDKPIAVAVARLLNEGNYDFIDEEMLEQFIQSPKDLFELLTHISFNTVAYNGVIDLHEIRERFMEETRIRRRQEAANRATRLAQINENFKPRGEFASALRESVGHLGALHGAGVDGRLLQFALDKEAEDLDPQIIWDRLPEGSRELMDFMITRLLKPIVGEDMPHLDYYYKRESRLAYAGGSRMHVNLHHGEKYISALVPILEGRETLRSELQKGERSALWELLESFVHESQHLEKFEEPGDHTHHAEEKIEGYEDVNDQRFGVRMGNAINEILSDLEDDVPGEFILSDEARAQYVEENKYVRDYVKEDTDDSAASPIEDSAPSVNTNTPGGIDLNPDVLDLNIEGQGPNFEIPLNQPGYQNIQIDGLFPVIINITPVTNLPLFLGAATGKESPQLSHLK